MVDLKSFGMHFEKKNWLKLFKNKINFKKLKIKN